MMSTANEASKYASPKIRACYPNNPCIETTLVTDLVVSSSILPNFFEWTMYENTVTVNAPDSLSVGNYTMQVTHSTENSGD